MSEGGQLVVGEVESVNVEEVLCVVQTTQTLKVGGEGEGEGEGGGGKKLCHTCLS